MSTAYANTRVQVDGTKFGTLYPWFGYNVCLLPHYPTDDKKKGICSTGAYGATLRSCSNFVAHLTFPPAVAGFSLTGAYLTTGDSSLHWPLISAGFMSRRILYDYANGN